MSGEPFDNRLFVLILQHPQEKRERLATAGLTCTALRNAKLVIGLSWPNLGRALGRFADTKRWAVLYLGSARPKAYGPQREIVVVDRRGEPVSDERSLAVLGSLDGFVLLDGNWNEAKTLWWRNPWLLKLRRIVLNPPHSSLYGQIRREPRREALSTIEAAALSLKTLDPKGPEIEAALLGALDRLVADIRATRGAPQEPIAR